MTTPTALMSDVGVWEAIQLPSNPASPREDDPWHRWINLLESWLNNPNLAADEDVIPPSSWPVKAALAIAFDLMSKEEVRPPTAIVPDGEGGLAFQWRRGNSFMEIELGCDGTIEHRHFRDNRLVSRFVVEGAFSAP